MKKFKKWMLAFLTMGMALALSVACGGKKDNGDSSNTSSSSVSSSSSSVSSEEVSSETSSEVSSESSSESSSDVSSSSSSVSSEESSSENSSENSSETSSESSSETSSGEDGGEGGHVCITDGEWKSNKSGHWLLCTCGEMVQFSAHSGGTPNCGEKPVCDTCGNSYGTEKEHEYGDLTDGEHGMAYYCTCGDYLTNEDLVDFVVEVESGKDPVVLQLSDTQVVWYGDTAENQCYRYIREVVEETQPDLIILTGDVVYGRFDPTGSLLTSLINFMEGFDIPWAPVFGNHDNESLMGVDWQCAQLEAAENCLFKQGDITGNGNYSVGIEQDGELLRVFYMMDSNGCGSPMIDQNGNATIPEPGTNEVRTSAGFSSDQVMWFTREIERIHALDEDVKISFAFHIQPLIFKTAFEKYDEYNGLLVDGSNSELKNPLNLDTMETADDTDFGYLGRIAKGPWDVGNVVFNKMKTLGTDSIFVGHEHCNSASIVYEGVRFQYGQKSSTYDRFNWVTRERTIGGGYSNNMPAGATPLMGGTVIPISSEDGSIGTGYIAYYGDPFYFEPEPEPEPE
ncbi:MAG: metallophosphoesterase, partial [Clostridia bacterium]|nr:metallophosphoesterase [Clostridia bacterium]